MNRRGFNNGIPSSQYTDPVLTAAKDVIRFTCEELDVRQDHPHHAKYRKDRGIALVYTGENIAAVRVW